MNGAVPSLGCHRERPKEVTQEIENQGFMCPNNWRSSPGSLTNQNCRTGFGSRVEHHQTRTTVLPRLLPTPPLATLAIPRSPQIPGKERRGGTSAFAAEPREREKGTHQYVQPCEEREEFPPSVPRAAAATGCRRLRRRRQGERVGEEGRFWVGGRAGPRENPNEERRDRRMHANGPRPKRVMLLYTGK